MTVYCDLCGEKLNKIENYLVLDLEKEFGERQICEYCCEQFEKELGCSNLKRKAVSQ